MNCVYLVGAGMGEGSITERGKRLLTLCDCVLYDSLLDQTLLKICRTDCEKIYVGKRMGAHSTEQSQINGLLLECAKKYPLTVRLKGGDPFVFGRGGEEAEFLWRHGALCSAVPGVSSCIAAPECAGIPVTDRGTSDSFHVYTAHGGLDYEALARQSGTLVFLMGRSKLKELCNGLIEAGMRRETPAALISNGGTAFQTTVVGTLYDLPQLAIDAPAPAVVVVGETARAPKTPPLKRVGIAGTDEFVTSSFNEALRRGMEGVDLGFFRIDPLPFDGFFGRIAEYSVLAFTSGNGVRQFFGRAKELAFDFRRFSPFRFAAVGKRTADALAEFGFTADVLPETSTAEGLAQALRNERRVAVLRAEGGDPALSAIGDEVFLYRTVAEEERLRRAAELAPRCDVLVFGSRKGAETLLDSVTLEHGKKIVCIGEKTAQAVRERGFMPRVCASPSYTEIIREAEQWSDSDG